MAIARERLLTARFDYFELRDSARGVDAGFVYEVDHKLTPGDFAQVERRARLFPFEGAEQVLRALEAAVAIKKTGPSRPVGFLAAA